MDGSPGSPQDSVAEPHWPTTYWHKLDDGRVQCDLCPRACQMRDGQRGLCFVRMAQDGQVVLTTYGRSSGFCIDPIEKKPLSHFLPGTPVLSFGTAGCNLACKFCQNWDISKSREMDTLADRATPETIANAAAMTGCRSVAFTYNDPVIFLEYAVDIAAACRERGIRTVAVTAAYISAAARGAFFGAMDAANVDLKAFTEDFYRTIAKGHLNPVLDSLIYLKQETDVWFELTTLLIPGENDGDAELHALAAWVMRHLGPDVPVHFTAFHPDYKMRDKPRTPPETLARARRIALSAGIRYAYVGNVHDTGRSSTHCHVCGARTITRDWHTILDWQLDDTGACRACGTPTAGVFDGPPGTWGARRAPVRLNGPGGLAQVMPTPQRQRSVRVFPKRARRSGG